MKARLFPSFLVAAAFSLLLLSVARASDASVATQKFSDPSKPGTVKIIVGRGDIKVKGANVSEVSIKSESNPETDKPRKDGLRVITTSSGYALNEKDNVITLDYGSRGWTGGGSSDFELTVPSNTNVIVATSWGGSDITCSDLTGDIEVRGTTGDVRLNNIAGGASVSTMNGEIFATIREFHEGKTLSFVTYNGEITLRVPADAKANVRLRSQNGEILTDFDEKVLVTKTESAPRVSRGGRVSRASVIPEEAQIAIRDAIKLGTQAARDVAQVARDAAEEAKEDATRDALAEARHKKDEASVKRLEAKLAEIEASSERLAPMPPIPPVPPLPPMTGGKIVAGTLNGGGPELHANTMNGDVKLLSPNWKK